MSKSDDIDRSRAAKYAWRFFAPGDEVPESSVSEPRPDDRLRPTGGWSDPGSAPEVLSSEVFDTESIDPTQAIADSVDRVWALDNEAAQADATATLWARIDETAGALFDMRRRPLQCMRLVRLAARHHERLSDAIRRRVCVACMWLDHARAEIIDLMIDIARAGALRLADTLRTLIEGKTWPLAHHRDAGARLLRLAEHARSVRERYLALRWLSLGVWPEATGLLRRMLREPCFSVRCAALEILDARFPDAIQADDLSFLLEEALIHVPPAQLDTVVNARALHRFPPLLMRAVVRRPPPGGHLPLERILDREHGFRHWDCGLDDTWALCTLAAAYPERAVPRIDQLFRRVESDRRERAVSATGHLPDELAWPRLLSAAGDGVVRVAEMAKEIWLRRCGTTCPVDELAGAQVGLLEAPPSDRFRARLTLLRHGAVEVRAAMAEVLLSEAPDPEALVLLLFIAVDDYLWIIEHRPGLPVSFEALSAAIISRFGARGIQGLCELAVRYPAGRWRWLYAISRALDREVPDIPEAALPVLREAAIRCLAEALGHETCSSSDILAKAGTPPELFARLWSIVRNPADEHYVRASAADALAAMLAGHAERDRVILAELEAALAAGDLWRFGCAATAGLRCKLPEATTLALRALAEYGPRAQDDLAVTDALALCVRELESVERMPAGWRDAALAQPGTQAFAAAARTMLRPSHLELSPETVAALRRAMESDSPMAAAEAVIVLGSPLTRQIDAPVAVEVAARAPLRLCAKILCNLTFGTELPPSSWPLFELALTSADPTVTDCMRHSFPTLHTIGWTDELLAIGDRIVGPTLRYEYGEWRDMELKYVDYWQDAELATGEDEVSMADIMSWAGLT